jgi:hypothetical protein
MISGDKHVKYREHDPRKYEIMIYHLAGNATHNVHELPVRLRDKCSLFTLNRLFLVHIVHHQMVMQPSKQTTYTAVRS